MLLLLLVLVRGGVVVLLLLVVVVVVYHDAWRCPTLCPLLPPPNQTRWTGAARWRWCGPWRNSRIPPVPRRRCRLCHLRRLCFWGWLRGRCRGPRAARSGSLRRVWHQATAAARRPLLPLRGPRSFGRRTTTDWANCPGPSWRRPDKVEGGWRMNGGGGTEAVGSGKWRLRDVWWVAGGQWWDGRAVRPMYVVIHGGVVKG